MQYMCGGGGEGENFGRELNLAVWWSIIITANLIFILCMYTCMYGDPLLNRQIYKSANIKFLQWWFRAQPPNLIPTNIFQLYTV